MGISGKVEDPSSPEAGFLSAFSVFERLYAEAYKPQNHHETEYEKSVKKKIIGPAWRPNPSTGKSRPTGSGVGFH